MLSLIEEIPNVLDVTNVCSVYLFRYLPGRSKTRDLPFMDTRTLNTFCFKYASDIILPLSYTAVAVNHSGEL